MKILFFVLFGILLFSCEMESKPKDLTEDEVYSLINEIILDDSLDIPDMCFQFDEIILKGGFLEEFSKKDILFHKKQRNLFKGITVRSNKLKFFSSKTKSIEQIKIGENCHYSKVKHISFPIISIDRKKILLEFNQQWSTEFGGPGGKYLYEKIKGHWVLTNSYDNWISENCLSYLTPKNSNNSVK